MLPMPQYWYFCLLFYSWSCWPEVCSFYCTPQSISSWSHWSLHYTSVSYAIMLSALIFITSDLLLALGIIFFSFWLQWRPRSWILHFSAHLFIYFRGEQSERERENLKQGPHSAQTFPEIWRGINTSRLMSSLQLFEVSITWISKPNKTLQEKITIDQYSLWRKT